MILGIDVGQKNLGVCVFNPETQRILLWAIWESGGSWAKDVSQCLQTYSTSLPEGIQKVVIEHQPSKNPSMVRIMHYIEFWFVTHGYDVHLQDSKHKLLFASTLPYFPKDCTDVSWTYYQRKKLAVRTVEAYVQQTEQPLQHIFAESKKKDDLADSLLHAMAFNSFSKVTVSQQTKDQKPKKVVARKPTEKQLRTGRLSPSNVKYLLQDIETDDLDTYLKKEKRLARAVKKHFTDIQGFIQLCRCK